MKILYGVQATGNGHIARARVMAGALSRLGAKIDWLLSGRSRESLFGVERFGDFALRTGLTFVVENGRVRYLKTALGLPLLETVKDIRALELSNYDLVISDFEPITAWAARLGNKPSVGISHQCAFRYAIPMAGANPVASGVLRHFAPVRHAIGLHWDSFGFPILPPLIDLGDTTREPGDPATILVYLPFESAQDIARTLRPLRDYRFTVYCGADPDQSTNNLLFRPYGKESFAADLHRAGGVICNAGFELPSECIHLGKRMLVKPVAGQMEQMSNALALKQLGYGTIMQSLDSSAIAHWLGSPAGSGTRFPDSSAPLADWLLSGRWDDLASLARAIW